MPLRLEAFPVVYAGTRIHFYDGFNADRVRSRSAHYAIDIGTARGTPVVCSVEGRVIRQWVSQRERNINTGSGWSDAGGNIVIVEDTEGFAHYFAHLNTEPQVGPGDQVQPGSSIGFVGNSGTKAAGSHPHLHYQVWRIGSDRAEESASGIFTRPFGRAENPYSELVRTARAVGAAVGDNGGVFIRRGAGTEAE